MKGIYEKLNIIMLNMYKKTATEQNNQERNKEN